MENSKGKYALLFKALADPNRLLIIEYLMEGERCACRVLECLKISQPTLSHHMKILCDSGIVNLRKEGKWTHYSLNYDKFLELQKLLAAYASRDSKKVTLHSPHNNEVQ